MKRWWKVPLIAILALAIGWFLFVWIAVLLAIPWAGGIPYLLLFGWMDYLASLPHRIIWNWWAIAGGAVGLLLAVGSFHIVARRIASTRQSIWPWRWSAGISILVLVVFSVSLAIGGVAHQAAWLSREKWVERRPSIRVPGEQEFFNASHLLAALRLYAEDEGGHYPSTLEHLVASGSLDMETLDRLSLCSGDDSAPPAPWIYVRGLTRSAPNDLPILIAPRVMKNERHGNVGRRIIGTNDGGIELMKPSQIRDLMPTWRKGYDALGIPLPTVLREYETLATQQ